jgi:DNA mismatch repair protein MutS
MLFTTDKQTQEDLNIYGKQGKDSIFSLFNRTSTLNGSRLLTELFRYPLSEAGAINARSKKISYLQNLKTAFPFSSELFDQAEQYLANKDERTKIPAERPTFEKKLTSLVTSNADYKQIMSGIASLIEIIQLLNRLLTQTFFSADSPFINDEETLNISRILNSEPINQLLAENFKSKLVHEKLALYDTMLRFREQETMHQLLRYIYQLDVYLTVARVAAERNFVFPKALEREAHVIKITGFYHPQLKNAVANTLDISADSNVVFLTGANMAGKSTFMKSLGIAMYLAHMGFPVAAKDMEFSVLDGIYTTISWDRRQPLLRRGAADKKSSKRAEQWCKHLCDF